MNKVLSDSVESLNNLKHAPTSFIRVLLKSEPRCCIGGAVASMGGRRVY